MLNTPLPMLLVMLAGWLNEEHRAVIGSLKEENRVLRELHGKKRLRFNDEQRRRLAAKGRGLGRRASCSKTQPTRGSRVCRTSSVDSALRSRSSCWVLDPVNRTLTGGKEVDVIPPSRCRCFSTCSRSPIR